ncbi:unnamed protein product [Chilo suppressalis]|uniref:C2H2-type domain-containing protein n=1 Tax=Chilo suppressalis TaxID=168631 RepID=A0ABN8B896_CHISP|nr:unnamed protein product [Chilo suppressalis]
MNTKSSKRSATSRILQNNKDEAEVFVLPPNLLEKLGIQLGNIQPTQECPANKLDHRAVQVKHKNKENNYDTENLPLNSFTSPILKETSILETANLMKNSVFLSPTFVPTLANVIAGEVEIANISKHSLQMVSNNELNIEHSHNLVDTYNIQEKINTDTGLVNCDERLLKSYHKQIQTAEEHINIIKNLEESCIKTITAKSPSLSATKKQLDIQVKQPIEITDIKNGINEMKKNISQQLTSTEDGLISSEKQVITDKETEDCQKITLEDLQIKDIIYDLSIDEIAGFEANFLDTPNFDFNSEAISAEEKGLPPIPKDKINMSKSKVQIVSEEIINCNKVRSYKLPSSFNETNFIPVTVGTIISTKKDDTNYLNNNQHKSISIFDDDQGIINSVCLHTTSLNKDDEKTDFSCKVTDYDIPKNNHNIISDDNFSEHDSMILNEHNQLQEHHKEANLNDCSEIHRDENGDSLTFLDDSTLISNFELVLSDVNSTVNTQSTNNLGANGNDVAKCDNNVKSDIDKVPPQRHICNHTLTDIKVSDQSLNHISNVRKDNEVNGKKKFLPILTAKTNNTNQTSNKRTKLKSCVQGVEKPGGNGFVEVASFANIKTYQRVKRNNSTLLQQNVTEAHNEVTNNDIDTVSDENTILGFEDTTQDYCLCNDFGQYSHYDCQDVYAHIHFLGNNSVSIGPEIIYDIYNENIVGINHDTYEDLQDAKKIEEKEMVPICWKTISKAIATNYDCKNLDLQANKKAEKIVVDNVPAIFEILKEDDLNRQNGCSDSSLNINAKSVAGIVHNYDSVGNMESSENKKIELDKNEILSENFVTETTALETFTQITNQKTSKEMKTSLQPHSTKFDIVTDNYLEKLNVTGNISFDMKKDNVKLYNSNNEHLINMNIDNDAKSNNMIDVDQANQPLQISYNVPISIVNQNHSNQIFRKLLDDNMEYMKKNCKENDTVHNSNIAIKSEVAVCDKVAEKTINLANSQEVVEDVTVCSADKRKRKKISEEGFNLFKMDESVATKNVKCGLCKQMLAKSDWNDHCSQKHNSVAWKLEQKIDFVDGNLIEELKNTLQVNNILECNFCNFKINHLPTFILHIKKCVQYKVANCYKDSADPVICGVCKKHINTLSWRKHLIEHNYLAWIDGEDVLDLKNENQVQCHLKSMSRDFDGLVCNKCGLKRKQAKKFLEHVKKCNGDTNVDCGTSSLTSSDVTLDTSVDMNMIQNSCHTTTLDANATWDNSQMDIEGSRRESTDCTKSDKRRKRTRMSTFSNDGEEVIRKKCRTAVSESRIVKCGVCKIDVPLAMWKTHLGKAHNNLAWKDEEPPLTSFPDDNESITHVDRPSMNSEEKEVICGVCKNNIQNDTWIDHIKENHNYLAWKDGDIPLDMEDEDAVRDHLKTISKMQDGLICTKCSVKKKYPKIFLEHVRNCSGPTSLTNNDESIIDVGRPSINSEEKEVICGVCKSNMHNDTWMDHIKEAHNYLAWKDGQIPLNLEDEDAVRVHLKTISKMQDGLICTKCSVKKKYPKIFLEHVRNCSGPTSLTNNDKSIIDIGSIKSEEKEVICGVCKSNMQNDTWIDHIKEAHNYLAWKDGDIPLDLEDEAAVRDHLKTISKMQDGLICTKCSVKKKYPKMFLEHVRNCSGSTSFIGNNQSIIHVERPSIYSEEKEVMCGVCKMNMHNDAWIDHIKETHNYLAWKDGDIPLDMEDEDVVCDHLKTISKLQDGLICTKCSVKKKYPKIFLEHVRNCSGPTSVTDKDESLNDIDRPSINSEEKEVICGVCKSHMQNVTWIDHIKEAHNYLAWKDGDIPLDLEDEVAVRDHLKTISKMQGGLICTKCSVKKKYPKMFLDHLRNCTGPTSLTDIDESIVQVDRPSIKSEEKEVICGVCKMNMQNDTWIDHIKEAHNYLAWKDGENPLDLEDEDAVRDHLKTISKKQDGLICAKCSARKKHSKLFLKHVRNCTRSASLTDNDESIAHVDRSSIISEEKEVKCGVCKMNIQNETWIDHIKQEHNYLAWKDGKKSLDMEDDDAVWDHLRTISKNMDGLVCIKCNVIKKYPKAFLDHVRICTGTALLPVKKESSNKLKRPSTVSEVACGVCKMELQNSTWIDHIKEAHNYLAWTDGETPLDLDDKDVVRCHLKNISKSQGGLACAKCNTIKKNPKKFLDHVRYCSGSASFSDDDKPIIDLKRTSVELKNKQVTCGVCKMNVQKVTWIDHIKEEHNYLAWKDGEPPLDLENEDTVRHYLKNISDRQSGLICIKCNAKKKYPKTFLEHVRLCTGASSELESVQSDLNSTINIDEANKCGVCSKDIPAGGWIKHIQVAHDYLAWRDGDQPLQLDDQQAVKEHLTNLIRIIGHLVCAKCGFRRRISTYYMAHMGTCDGVSQNNICEDTKSLLDKNEGLYECAICHEKILPNKWKAHAMDKHYNVAWVVGDVPIDVKSPYGADKFLKEYKQIKKKLECNICGETRTSFLGFFFHVITCGKSDEETEMYKEECSLCGNKYVGVYRNVHMAWHREKEMAKERKLQKEKAIMQPQEESSPSGRRKAAMKANKVIEKYQENDEKYEYKHKCEKCGFETDSIKQFQHHKCESDAEEDSAGSEKESESDPEEGLDEDLSDQELKTERKKDLLEPSWLPHQFDTWKGYYEMLLKNFRESNLSTDKLFSEWHISQYHFVTNQVSDYSPRVLQSCQIQINGNWKVYEQFEGCHSNRVVSMFVGGSVQCISWVPTRFGTDKYFVNNYLAVSGHSGNDTPRVNYDDTPSYPGLIQLWDVGTFSTPPKLALGIAHNFGTVWGMDWCPSGVRDDINEESESQSWARLGLLAVACSNGSAYILSVPYPTSVSASSDNLFVKLKPVAELKMCSKKSDRKIYQATAISWSKRHGHAEIVVGYSDGSMARYDLNTESPLLKTTEDGVTVIYSYYDERSLNSCVTAVDSFPGVGPMSDSISGTCPTGAVMANGAVHPSRVTSHSPATHAAFTPAWPSVLLAGDDGLVHQSPNELEWHGGGRRLGVMCTSASCLTCGRLLVYAPPLLRSTRNYAPCVQLSKKSMAYINMVPLNDKSSKSKQKMDELSVKMEPITYDSAIRQYAVEFKHIETGCRPSTALREPLPERFPLADVTSMAYCTSEKYHDWAAVATHSGVIFMFKTL